MLPVSDLAPSPTSNTLGSATDSQTPLGLPGPTTINSMVCESSVEPHKQQSTMVVAVVNVPESQPSSGSASPTAVVTSSNPEASCEPDSTTGPNNILDPQVSGSTGPDLKTLDDNMGSVHERAQVPLSQETTEVKKVGQNSPVQMPSAQKEPTNCVCASGKNANARTCDEETASCESSSKSSETFPETTTHDILSLSPQTIIASTDNADQNKQGAASQDSESSAADFLPIQQKNEYSLPGVSIITPQTATNSAKPVSSVSSKIIFDIDLDEHLTTESDCDTDGYTRLRIITDSDECVSPQKSTTLSTMKDADRSSAESDEIINGIVLSPRADVNMERDEDIEFSIHVANDPDGTLNQAPEEHARNEAPRNVEADSSEPIEEPQQNESYEEINNEEDYVVTINDTSSDAGQLQSANTSLSDIENNEDGKEDQEPQHSLDPVTGLQHPITSLQNTPQVSVSKPVTVPGVTSTTVPAVTTTPVSSSVQYTFIPRSSPSPGSSPGLSPRLSPRSSPRSSPGSSPEPSPEPLPSEGLMPMITEVFGGVTSSGLSQLHSHGQVGAEGHNTPMKSSNQSAQTTRNVQTTPCGIVTVASSGLNQFHTQGQAGAVTYKPPITVCSRSSQSLNTVQVIQREIQPHVHHVHVIVPDDVAHTSSIGSSQSSTSSSPLNIYEDHADTPVTVTQSAAGRKRPRKSQTASRHISSALWPSPSDRVNPHGVDSSGCHSGIQTQGVNQLDRSVESSVRMTGLHTIVPQSIRPPDNVPLVKPVPPIMFKPRVGAPANVPTSGPLVRTTVRPKATLAGPSFSALPPRYIDISPTTTPSVSLITSGMSLKDLVATAVPAAPKSTLRQPVHLPSQFPPYLPRVNTQPPQARRISTVLPRGMMNVQQQHLAATRGPFGNTTPAVRSLHPFIQAPRPPTTIVITPNAVSVKRAVDAVRQPRPQAPPAPVPAQSPQATLLIPLSNIQTSVGGKLFIPTSTPTSQSSKITLMYKGAQGQTPGVLQPMLTPISHITSSTLSTSLSTSAAPTVIKIAPPVSQTVSVSTVHLHGTNVATIANTAGTGVVTVQTSVPSSSNGKQNHSSLIQLLETGKRMSEHEPSQPMQRLLGEDNLKPAYKAPMDPPDWMHLDSKDIQRYLCPGCQDEFITKPGLDFHWQRESASISFRCIAHPCRKASQDMTFTNKCQLRAHISSHMLDLPKHEQCLKTDLEAQKAKLSSLPEKWLLGQKYLDIKYEAYRQEGLLKKFATCVSSKDYLKHKLADKPDLFAQVFGSESSMEEDKNAAEKKQTKGSAKEPESPPLTPVTVDDNEMQKKIGEVSPPVGLNKNVPYFWCPECKSAFRTKSAMVGHMGTTRKHNTIFECDKCLVAVNSKCAFEAHKRIHERSEPFVCPECSQVTYGTRELFLKHLKRRCFHFNRFICFSCEKCDKNFHVKQIWQKHMKEHTEIYYKCLACPMAFKGEKSFAAHNEKDHGNEANHKVIAKCPFCDTVFNNIQRLLSNHLGSHIQQSRPSIVFKCLPCNLVFNIKGSFIHHMALKHASEVIAGDMCCVCGKEYRTQHNLRAHFAREHPNEYLLSKMPPPGVLEEVIHPDLPPLLKDVQVHVDTTASGDQPATQEEPPNCPASPGVSVVSIKSEPSSDHEEVGAGDAGLDRLTCQSCLVTLEDRVSFERHMGKHRFMARKRAAPSSGGPKAKIKIPKLSENFIGQTVKVTEPNDGEGPVMLVIKQFTRQFPGAPDPEPLFPCSECDHCFYSDDECRQHLKDAHDIAPLFPCHLCGNTYSTAFQLKKHGESHEGKIKDRPFVCWLCQENDIRKCYPKRGMLVKHLVSIHKVKRDMIDYTRFPDFQQLSPPSTPNGGQVESQMAEAPDNVDNASEKDAHKRSRTNSLVSSIGDSELSPVKRLKVDGDSTYSCAKCSFLTEDREQFNSHIAKHKTKDQGHLQCQECGLLFTVQPSLKRHLFMVHRVRDLEKYMADTGLDLISQPKEIELDIPMNIETKVVKLRANGAMKERKDKSPGNEPVANECNVCYKVFDCSGSLRTHMRTHGMAFIRSKRLT